MPSVSTIYLGFFCVALTILAAIVCLKLPELYRSLAKLWRQGRARKTRTVRMLADLEQLDADASTLEGLCLFDSEVVLENHRGFRKLHHAQVERGMDVVHEPAL
jgi:hypothetical protein